MNMLSMISPSSSATFSLRTTDLPLFVSSTMDTSQARSIVMDFSLE